MPATCRNCAAPLDGPYCAQCGQRDLPLREPFWKVLGRFAGEQLVLDSRLARTLRPFLLRPGLLTREHHAGRRARYMEPLRLYLLMALLLFLAASARSLFDAVGGTETGAPILKVNVQSGFEDALARWFGEDSAVVERWERKSARFGELSDEERNQLFVDTALAKTPTAMLLLLPAFALLLRLAWLRTGWLYAQHFVFVLHAHAFCYLAFVLPVLVPHRLTVLAVALAIPAYFVAALRGAYREPLLPTCLRAIVVLPFYVALLVPVMLALLVLSVLAA